VEKIPNQPPPPPTFLGLDSMVSNYKHFNVPNFQFVNMGLISGCKKLHVPNFQLVNVVDSIISNGKTSMFQNAH
jgi:hypothetical protein